MMTGSTIINDGVLLRQFSKLSEIHEQKDYGWPIMGVDVGGTYWIKMSSVVSVSKSAEPLKMFSVTTSETGLTNKDNSSFFSTMDHQLLCKDGEFRTLQAIIDGKYRMQHIRGNGHSVSIDQVTPIEDQHGYGIVVDHVGCYVHNMLIHRGEQ